MPFCANCGAAVQGRYCPSCGAPVEAGAPPLPNQVPPPPPAAPGAGLTENAAAACCYLLFAVTGVIFLVMAPYNKNRLIRFHAFQSIFLTVAWVVFWTIVNILVSMIGAYSLYSLTSLVGLAFFVLWIYLMVTAYQGKKTVLPLIGPLAQQQS